MKWWTHSWNPVIGCTPASPGCDNCYAKSLHDSRHKAFVAGSRVPACYSEPFETVRCLEERLARPLGWKKPRRVFVNSMSDLFHPDVPIEFLDRVFAVMALASQHTFMICTKRADRMREYVFSLREGFRDLTESRRSLGMNLPQGLGIVQAVRIDGLPNVWLGTTAENQEQADARIPILLDTPAARRFVSVEPMLGPVDLSRWIHPVAMMDPEKAPRDWAQWNAEGFWPDWVPESWRRNIERFWSCFGRDPRAWLKDAVQQGAVPHGMVITCAKPLGGGGPVTGKFLHTWNNMCVLVDDSGEAHVTSTPRAHLFDPGPGSASYQPISWVICGGESGPSARPMHPDWARGLRDQCAAAGVPFFFKQFGESVDDLNRQHRAHIDTTFWMLPDGTTGDKQPQPEGCVWMSRLGSRRAGRLLDGREHNDMPEVLHA